MKTFKLLLLLPVFFSAFRTQAQPYRQPMDNYEGTGATTASIALSPTTTATYSVTVSDHNGRKDDEKFKAMAIEHPPSEFTCPCTEANTLNISASPDGTPYSSLNLPTTLDPSVHHGCIAIAGRLIIDQDVTITGCANIRMQPCAEIVVTAFRELTMRYNTIYGCDQMWQRIQVEPSGRLTFLHNVVSDAEHALWIKPVTFGLINPTRVDIQHNRFERNHIGLFIPGKGGGFYGGVVHHTPFIGNSILCKGPGNALGNLLPPCDAGLANYDPEHGYAGVVVLGANFDVGSYTGAVNTFSNLRNGVIGEGTFLNASRSNFNNMIGYSDFPPSFALSRGIGVSANRGGIYSVQDANFNGAGHALYGNNALLTLRRSTTNGVRVGVEAWSPGGLRVLDNPGIRFEDFGVRAWSLRASPWTTGAYVVDNNKFFTQGVQKTAEGDWTLHFVNFSNLTLYDGAGRISRNEMYINNRVGGLLISNLNSWSIADNYVEFSAHPDGVVPGGSGIYLQNSSYNYLHSNSIRDVTDVSYPATHGLVTLTSLGNRFCCNSTEGNGVGSLFWGACYQTQYRHTDMARHTFSLWLPGTPQGYTVIGQQPPQVLGPATNNNRFGPASGVAQNDGPDLILVGSKFFVTNEYPPHYPQQVVTPNGSPDSWFGINNATPGICATDVNCPTPVYPPGSSGEIEPTDILIAQNVFGSIPGGASLQWEGERDLYARLKAHPEMLGQSPIVDAFYADREAGSAIKSFYTAEAWVAAVEEVPADWAEALRTAVDSIEAIEAEANAVLEALAGVGTREDSLDIYWQSQSVRQRIAPYVAEVVEIQDRLDSLRQARASAALPSVLALPADDVLQANRKEVLRVYLEVTASSATQLSEGQFEVISSIAHQCPLAGGSAVSMARALYQLNEQKHFDDFELCAIPHERSTPASPELRADEVLLWPNPTGGHVQLFLPGISAQQQVHVRIADLSGKVVVEKTLSTADGNIALDASQLSRGIYFCRLYTSGKALAPLKLMIER